MSKLSIAGFTNLGYHLHSRAFRPIDADLSGQTAIVTGATGGLGRETASSLAAMGWAASSGIAGPLSTTVSRPSGRS